MRHPGQGSFQKEAVPKPLRKFCPTEALGSINEIDLEQLAAEGRKLVIIDVDNTLMEWKSEEVPAETKAWVKRGQDVGLTFCILSNTRRHDRLDRIAKSLGIEWVKGKFKPNPEAYHRALEQFKVKPEEAIMVGDQLLTDILGASRAGIDSIWVQRISSVEFLGTRVISRNVEHFLGLFLRRWFQSTSDSQRSGFFQRDVVRQLLKFGVVGGTATVVDLGIHWWLMYKATFNGALIKDQVGTWMIQSLNLNWPLDADHLDDAAFAPLKIGPVLVAILVSYILNWSWTFRTADSKMSINQASRFYAVALVGMVISVTASSMAKLALPQNKMAWGLASLAGIAAGFAWNFNAQRRWTFKK